MNRLKEIKREIKALKIERELLKAEHPLLIEARERGFYDVGNVFFSEFTDNNEPRVILPYNDKHTEVTYRIDPLGIRSSNGMTTDGRLCSNPLIMENGKWAQIIKLK